MGKFGLTSRVCGFVLCFGAIAGISGTASSTSSTECEQPAPEATTMVTQTASPIPDMTQYVMEVAQWTSDPGIALTQAVSYLGPQIESLWSPKAWPDIADKARQAKVPILMYHDILPQKQVFFDVTPDEFEEHLKLIQTHGLTPISLEQLVNHLETGSPLPSKPILLTFDDGYQGHYQYVLPLLKKYGYPGAFSIYTHKIGQTVGRPGVTWAELDAMKKDPLVTIVAHSISHPEDLRTLTDEQLRKELVESRQILEDKLGIPIDYFTYPAGFYDDRVTQMVAEVGYKAALTMDETELNEKFANESANLLTLERFGQSKIQEVLAPATGGAPLGRWASGFNFQMPIAVNRPILDNVGLILISGGKPMTIHAQSRAQVEEILVDTPAIAGVDGGFFSLEYLDSNVMIGPVFSQHTQKFVPGNKSENPRLNGRPLVMISPTQVKFIPFQADKHNTLEGVKAEMANVTDAFVAAAWLVRDGQPQPDASFGNLFDFNAERHRAFWGINQSGVPVIGVSIDPVGSVHLGELLAQAGFQDAVMLDSGASTSLAYRGDSLVGYIPRPVPHVVGLVPPPGTEPQPACKPKSTAEP